jgi:hypothetical protein
LLVRSSTSASSRWLIAAQLVDVPRLGQQPVDADLVDGVQRRVEVGVSADQQAPCVGLQPARVAEELDAAHPRHAQVGDDDVEAVKPQQRHRLLGRGGGRHGELGVLPEEAGERTTQAWLVVHVKDASAGGSAPHGASHRRSSTNLELRRAMRGGNKVTEA